MAPILFSALIPATVFADNAAVDLLNKMNKALHELNYKGTLAYLQGNTLSTLHIDHSVVNGVEGERVVRLNEAGSEVSRELKGFSLSSIPQIRPEMEKVYSFDMGRENRVANIPCRIITARPKDRERYLQKYCIDTVSGMLLDYMLVGKSHKPVEQFMFTTIEIRVPESVPSNTASICNAGDCALQALNFWNYSNSRSLSDGS
ncbi:Sigma factor AlgU regulatory protein MucB [Nymphon striatum]|nr:Sigma factor AlgU regulatory protein MucB [Nymphon striatum]